MRAKIVEQALVILVDERDIFICKAKLGFAIESAVYLMDLLSAIATPCNEYKMYVGVVEQEADKLTACEACTFDNTGLNHRYIVFFITFSFRG